MCAERKFDGRGVRDDAVRSLMADATSSGGAMLHGRRVPSSPHPLRRLFWSLSGFPSNVLPLLLAVTQFFSFVPMPVFGKAFLDGRPWSRKSLRADAVATRSLGRDVRNRQGLFGLGDGSRQREGVLEDVDD